MIYADAEVLRLGNEQTLDNFNEGVIILDEEHMRIRYYNKAASISKLRNASSTNTQHDGAKPDYTSFVQENQLKQFSQIERADLKP